MSVARTLILVVIMANVLTMMVVTLVIVRLDGSRLMAHAQVGVMFRRDLCRYGNSKMGSLGSKATEGNHIIPAHSH